jgi:cell division protease FtsH
MPTPSKNLNPTIDDIEDDDEHAEGSVGVLKANRESAAIAFAAEALDAALSRKSRALIKDKSGIYILHLPHADWTKYFQRPVRNLSGLLTVTVVTEREKIGGILIRPGAEGLDIVHRGFSMMYLCQNPQEHLDEAVLAAADLTIPVPDTTPDLLRKVIRRVTGGVARGVTEAMARLDLSIIVSVIRPDRSARECVDNLQRAVDRRTAPAVSTVPSLGHLPLSQTVRGWTDQMLADLDAVKSGTLTMTEINFGLLEGPPGTGKSLIAESLAHTAGWAFVPTTVGNWFAERDGALGGVSKNLRSFIDEALASAPSIAFLDEIDAIPDRSTLDSRNREWWTPIITLLLTEVDRVRKSGKKVLILGATNYFSRLDAALIRPGRLSQRISVLPPSTDNEALALLRFYLRHVLSDADLSKLARFAIGATPAMVEGWTRSAQSLARSMNRPVELGDVMAQMMPDETRSAADVYAIAIHEIGHAVVAFHLGQDVKAVTTIPSGETGGSTTAVPRSVIATRTDVEDFVTIALAGRAADMVLGEGANAGAERDLATATELLLRASDHQGLGDGLVHAPAARLRSNLGREQLEDQLKRLLERAKDIISTDASGAKMLIDQLVQQRALSGADVAKVLQRGASPLRASSKDTRSASLRRSDLGANWPITT